MAMADKDVRNSCISTNIDSNNLIVDYPTDMTKNTSLMSNNMNYGSDEIDFLNHSETNTVSLQEAFKKFRKTKQANIRESKKMKKKQRKKNRTPAQMEALRYKFIEQAKKYFGVPYAKKYWPTDSEEYKSPLFLDCCGLVRRVMRDLSKDFGFHIGPWNQSYMYDTLPITVDREEDMKPGDLVFMSGLYTNPKNKKQRHNMTHVEIWLGDGPKTIGSRWNNGKVQVFDNYRFQAKSFHSEQYYFKSIDTWLKGICKSFCAEHPWRKSTYKPGKRSIFRLDDELEEEDERAGDSSSGTDVELDADDKDRMKKDLSSRMDVKVENPVDCMLSPLTTCTFMHDDHKEFGPHILTMNHKHRYVMDDTTDKTSPPTGNTLSQSCHQTNHSMITCNHNLNIISINNPEKQSESKTECKENAKIESDVKNAKVDKQLDENEKEVLKKSSLQPVETNVETVVGESLRHEQNKREVKKKPSLKHEELEYEGCKTLSNPLNVENTVSACCLLVEKESKIFGEECPASKKQMHHEGWCDDTLPGTSKSTRQVQSSLEDIDHVTDIQSESINHHFDVTSSPLPIANDEMQMKETSSNLKLQCYESQIQTAEECHHLDVQNVSDEEYVANSDDNCSDDDNHSYKDIPEEELDSDCYCLSDEWQCCCDCDHCLQDAPAFQGVEIWNGFATISPQEFNLPLPENKSIFKDRTSESMLCYYQHVEDKQLPIKQKQLNYLDESMLDRNQNYLSIGKETFPKNHKATNDLPNIDNQSAGFDKPSLSQYVKDNDLKIQEPEDSDRRSERSHSSCLKTVSKSECEGVDRKGSSGGDGKGEEKGDKRKGGGGGNPGGRSNKLPSCYLPSNMMNTFYIGGGNGVALVEGALLNLGWKRTTDKYDERFKLKWVECKSRINYQSFREGDQLVNHIPNCQLLTNKLGLINSLQEYERVTLSTRGRPPRLKLSDIVPETYKLDDKNDRESFLQTYQDGEIWICKPTGMNQGKGIFLLRTKEEVDKLLSEREEKMQQRKITRPLMSRIVQRYIHNPLLLDGRKFDIRAYMLIASTTPFLVLYHKGYVRLSCMPYDGDDTNLTTHLTNQYIQKKDPNYQDVKEDTAWSMDKFNDYINDKVATEKNVEQNWVYDCLTKQMQRVMLHCFNSVKHKLQSKIGYFDLYGLDFMIDTDMKVWMIEINVNPALSTNCSALKEVIPSVVEESINLSIECFEKSRKRQSLMPMNSLKGFAVLYCGSQPSAVGSRNHRSSSPSKDNTDKNIKSTQNSVNRKPVSPSRSFVPKNTPSTTSVPAQSKSGTSDANLFAKSPYNTTSNTTNKPALSQSRNTAQKQGHKQPVSKKPEPQKTDSKSDKTSPKSSASSSPSNKSTSQSSSSSREDVKLRMVHNDSPSTHSMDKNDRGN